MEIQSTTALCTAQIKAMRPQNQTPSAFFAKTGAANSKDFALTA
jgi:hypothetical protein